MTLRFLYSEKCNNFYDQLHVADVQYMACFILIVKQTSIQSRVMISWSHQISTVIPRAGTTVYSNSKA